MSLLKHSLYVILLCICYIGVTAQSPPDFIIKQYTVDDGLPSNECHRILQDSLGYIWIATDRGLVRYDGYEFRTFGPEAGLRNSSIVDMSIHGSKIYVMTLYGDLYVVDYASLTILPYPWQRQIDKYKDLSRIYNFYFDSIGSVLIEIPGYGVLRIDGNGKSDLVLKKSGRGNYASMRHSHFEGIVIGGSAHTIESNSGDLWMVDGLDSFRINRKFGVHTKGLNRLYLLPQNRAVYSIRGMNYFVDENSVVCDSLHSGFTGVSDYSSGILHSHLEELGLLFSDSWTELKKSVSSHLISNESVTDFCIDREGAVWASTLRGGVYKLRQSDFSSEIGYRANGQYISAIDINEKDLYYVVNNRLVFRQNAEGVEKVFENIDTEISDIQYVEGVGLVIASRPPVIFGEDRKIVSLKDRVDGLDLEISPNTIKELAGLYHFITSRNIYTFDSALKRHISSTYLASSDFKGRPYDMVQHGSDDHLVATDFGLELYEKGVLDEVTIHGLRDSVRINSVLLFRDKCFLATQGEGLIVLRDDTVEMQLLESDGLVSNNLEGLHLSRKGGLYLLSKNGFSEISFAEDWSYDIRNFSVAHGLPSNEINDVVERNDTLYIATSNGIVTFDQNYRPAASSEVVIENMSGSGFVFKDRDRLKASTNNIKIEFKALDYSAEGDVSYEYRVNSTNWVKTKSTTVDFIDLSPDKYTFHVRSKNRDGIWGSSTVVNWSILKPVWSRWYAWLAYLILGGACVYWLYRRRIAQIKERAHVEEEIRNLEKSALQAQMSPHFIFNSLNSIQSFITSNQKEEAMSYLTNFAQLIRAYLKASVENEISLDEEVRLLDNYLSLERLRLDGRFEYSFSIDHDINVYDTMIPSMLIQPFVENAVVHGMKGMRTQGIIRVSIVKEDKGLSVLIEDNGHYSHEHKSDHTSYGSAITQKRLRHLHSQKSDMDIDTRVSEAGTAVSFTIPFAS